MTSRLTALLVAIPALVAGLLVTSPAEAATTNASVKTRTVAMYPSSYLGAGRVYVSCSASTTCRGTLQFVGDSYKRSYAVKARSSAYVTVWMHRDNPDYPEGFNADGSPVSHSNVGLTIDESEPSNSRPRTYTTMRTETRVTKQQIRGSILPVNGAVAGMRDLRVELVRALKGGNTEVVKSAAVTESGSEAKYSFTVGLGMNNSPSTAYRLKIRGVDPASEARSWYYRGADGIPTGGGRYLRDATSVQARATGPYDADFSYTSIKGSVSSGQGSQVTVAAPPPSFSSSSTANRELDYPRCANVFGHADADASGRYTVGFLPATNSIDNRYMIGLRSPGGSVEVWYGKDRTPYGSCYDATNYTYSRANLITLNGPLDRFADEVSTNLTNDVTVTARFSSAYRSKATTSDRWLRLREQVPGVPILDSPVVAERVASSSTGSAVFTNLRPGRFWVEVGRRTGCSAWYPSRYPDNSAYFKGVDRSAERWKTVAGKYAEYAKSYAMGYIARTPPSGYKGWMYRGYCKAYGTGVYEAHSLRGAGNTYPVTLGTNPQGAVVKGRVTRVGGKTNKEMMVRLSSSDGKRVIRTDLTDGSGYFYVAGLASGNWTISVNSDSWRGIGRSFSGKHSVKVYRGHGYNVGTLRFNG
ncbi:hypothetical protein [Aeromicrobium sp.]|uniref:hypothetical protein n=1 Tax=Aeromicrobium sp. TaxID=1871063 RepID=UPI003C5A3D3B